MTKTEHKYTVANGKIIPKSLLSPQEKAIRIAQDKVFEQRCQAIFEQVQPELIKEYYNWFMIILPDDGEYFIDRDEKVARQKADEKYPNAKGLIVRINETGVCGKI